MLWYSLHSCLHDGQVWVCVWDLMKICISFFLFSTFIIFNDAGKNADKSISVCAILSSHKKIIAQAKIFVYSNMRKNQSQTDASHNFAVLHARFVPEYSPALFYTVLDQCRDMGVLSLTLSGGEPMLHKNFCDFLRQAKKFDFSINILSNLTLLNDEIIAEMKANRLSSVQVSLYSMNPEIHDSITKLSGSFYKTRDNILRLIENDIPLQISCPTMKQNRNCFADVMQWAHEHKCRATTDYIMMARYDHTTDNLDNRLSLDEVGKIMKEVISLDDNYQRAILADNFDVQENRDRSDDLVCGVCVSSICMVANGNVYPCSGWQSYICGNVKEMSLSEIWNNSPKVKYLRSLRKRDFPECSGCENRGFCAMCMVRNANEDPEGNPLRINNHFCKVAALNKEIVLEWKEKLKA